MNITRLPEPALIRSALVTITGCAAFVLGHQVDTSWIEGVLIMYGLITPLIAGAIIRPVVTPVATGRHARGELDE